MAGCELDLAYPQVRLGIEDNGGDHLTPRRALRDLRREAVPADAGWTVRRFTARTVHCPHDVAVLVWRELVMRGVDVPSVSSPLW